jgi:hypothetical protein
VTLVVTVNVSYGPLDGGTFAFYHEPAHLTTVYAASQPSDRGWSPDSPKVRPEQTEQACHLKPDGTRQSRYVYSARAKKFLYDGTGKYS